MFCSLKIDLCMTNIFGFFYFLFLYSWNIYWAPTELLEVADKSSLNTYLINILRDLIFIRLFSLGIFYWFVSSINLKYFNNIISLRLIICNDIMYCSYCVVQLWGYVFRYVGVYVNMVLFLLKSNREKILRN